MHTAAFHQLELVDLPLNLAVAPAEAHGRERRIAAPPQADSQRLE